MVVVGHTMDKYTQHLNIFFIVYLSIKVIYLHFLVTPTTRNKSQSRYTNHIKHSCGQFCIIN